MHVPCAGKDVPNDYESDGKEDDDDAEDDEGIFSDDVDVTAFQDKYQCALSQQNITHCSLLIECVFAAGLERRSAAARRVRFRARHLIRTTRIARRSDARSNSAASTS